MQVRDLLLANGLPELHVCLRGLRDLHAVDLEVVEGRELLRGSVYPLLGYLCADLAL